MVGDLPSGLALAVFAFTLLATLAASLIGRKNTQTDNDADGLSHKGLNRWLIGLSAATTGNSGFIVTGAVGLGYSYGLHWLLLPLAWLLGDLLFWALFPEPSTA